jgi:ComF family protein
MIIRFKYHRLEYLAQPLASMLSGIARKEGLVEEENLLLSVPLHWTRRLGRGFDQATFLGQRLSHFLGKPFSHRNLRRIRATASQTGLSESKRRENVRGAFKVRRSEAVKGKRVLLVDDVMTTGATASECARTLLSAGAKEVSVLVVARAQPGPDKVAV